MILAYHGRWEPLEELRRRCGVSRDGSTARDIAIAARSYGLSATGRRSEPDGLRELPLPFIIFWNFNHFIVVTGFDGDVVLANDPSVGRRRLEAEEFGRCFTGVALTFEPAAGFTRAGHPPRLIHSFRERLSGSWAGFSYLMIVALMLIIPGIVVPAMTKIFINQYLILGLNDWLRPLMLAMGSATLLVALLTWLQQRYLLRLQVSLALSGGRKLFQHLFRLSPEFFAQRPAADINGRIQSVTRIATVLAGGFSGNLIGVVCIIFYGIVMACYSLPLAAIGFVYLLFSLACARYFYQQRQDESRLQAKAQARVSALAVNALQHIETVKATGSERVLFERWSGAQAQYVSTQQRMGASGARVSALPSMLGMLAGNLVLCVGAYEVIAGRLTIGDLIAFQILFAAFSAPIQSLVALCTTLPQTSADISRVDDMLRASLPAAVPTVAAPPKPRGRLEVRGLVFGYSRLAAPALKGIDLSVEPGQRIAVVGRSGSGKSTLLRVVAGLFTQWDGEILLDGLPIAAIDPTVRANAIGMVDQDIAFFGNTIRENLTLWDDSVSEATLIKAVRDAEVAEVIAARPRGLHSGIIEDARNFSGGERQRLEIARALVHEPTLLLLDEATSALDPVLEKLIDSNLRRRGCGCLIVAHRLSTVRDCDEIIVLDRGAVVQRGTHDVLLRDGGTYGELIRAQ